MIGATPPLFGWMIMDSVQMGTLTNLRLLLQSRNGQNEPLSVGQHALAGLGTGIVVSFVASPVEVRLYLEVHNSYTLPLDHQGETSNTIFF